MRFHDICDCSPRFEWSGTVTSRGDKDLRVLMKTFSVEDLGSRAGSLGLRTFLASGVNVVGLVPLFKYSI